MSWDVPGHPGTFNVPGHPRTSHCPGDYDPRSNMSWDIPGLPTGQETGITRSEMSQDVLLARRQCCITTPILFSALLCIQLIAIVTYNVLSTTSSVLSHYVSHTCTEERREKYFYSFSLSFFHSETTRKKFAHKLQYQPEIIA